MLCARINKQRPITSRSVRDVAVAPAPRQRPTCATLADAAKYATTPNHVPRPITYHAQSRTTPIRSFPFRVGKRSDGRCRPTLVKFGTVWDKRLLLAAKTKLKSFRQRGIFVRQDMSKDERLAAIARRTNARSQHSSAEVPHKSSPHHPLSSPNPSSHSFPSSPVLFGRS